MDQSLVPDGIWKSLYRYPSDERGEEFEGQHYMRLHRKNNRLIFESAAETSSSYLMIRLSINDHVATGSWQEETDPNGYYKGAVYYGALQMILSDDGREMKGKWIGFGKDMTVNVGPWELTYVGTSLPIDSLSAKAETEE